MILKDWKRNLHQDVVADGRESMRVEVSCSARR